jgi:hypothetical protein
MSPGREAFWPVGSGIGEAAWSILNRGLKVFFVCCCGHVGNALALSKRSGMPALSKAKTAWDVV